MRLTLIDGSGFIHRAYHALPPLTRSSDGQPVGVVYGFVAMLWRLRQLSQATHMAICFERHRSKARLQIYPQYKANRKPPDPDLVSQYPLAREAADAMAIPYVEQSYIEADDLIASYVETARGFDRVTIVSSDKDLLQLTERSHVIQWCPVNKREITAVQKFEVPAHLVCDAQALIGDTVDNVPGAPGIGPKKAAGLLSVFKSLDATLEAAKSYKPVPYGMRTRQILIHHEEQIRLSRKLVELNRKVPLSVPVSELAVREPDMDKLDAFLARMEFVSLREEIMGRVIA